MPRPLFLLGASVVATVTQTIGRNATHARETGQSIMGAHGRNHNGIIYRGSSLGAYTQHAATRSALQESNKMHTN